MAESSIKNLESDSGWNKPNDWVEYRKVGKIVYVNFTNYGGALDQMHQNWRYVCTLDVGFRPSKTIYFTFGAGSYNSSYYGTAKIESSGVLSVNSSQGTNLTNFAGSTAFPVD